MKRKRLEQSRLDNPNWLQKINLQELKRIELNFTECFSDSNDKVLKFVDNILFDGKKIVSYSSEVIN
jgi:hypothetical protein